MAPDAEDLEKVERRAGGTGYRAVPVHAPPGHRVAPPGHRVAPPGHRVAPPGHRVAPPGHRVAPPGHRVEPPGHRVAPARPAPARSWLERERARSPGENRRLLDHADPPSPKLQAGLTLGVWDVAKKLSKCPESPKSEKPKAKTKFQKRSEKLYSVLKPPYFILTIIVLIVVVHLCGSERARAQLEWAPGAWWRAPWRLLSYGLVHASATHLATNAIVALAVSWVLEREQSRGRVAGVWCAGLAAGALGAGALQPRVRVVGASAAVYALLTAHLPNVCLRFGHIPLWWFRPLSVVVLATSETLSWVLLRAPAADAQPWAASPVAWSAHMLGAAVGVPVGFLVFGGEHGAAPALRAARACSALALLAAAALASIHYVYWQDLDA